MKILWKQKEICRNINKFEAKRKNVNKNEEILRYMKKYKI